MVGRRPANKKTMWQRQRVQITLGATRRRMSARYHGDHLSTCRGFTGPFRLAADNFIRYHPGDRERAHKGTARSQIPRFSIRTQLRHGCQDRW